MRSDRVRAARLLVVAMATLVAVLSARPYAGAWNDGSRLAAVEALADQHTWAIGRSMFVRPNLWRGPPDRGPYLARSLRATGTRDMLFIRGHYYSDKPPVLSLIMAGVYDLLASTIGIGVARDPHSFVYAMTLATAGIGYVAAVWCILEISLVVGLSLGRAIAISGSLGFATVALPYARQVNSHLVLLGIASALLLIITRARQRADAPAASAIGAGALAGLGYAIDPGAGAIILAATAMYAICRWRDAHRNSALFAVAALPWIAAHHALNYAIGGSIVPANMNPAYFNWPGSAFNSANITGLWQHRSIGHAAIYALALLWGRRGFIDHNLPLFLALPAIAILLRERRSERPELAYAGCVAGATWLMYAVLSTNYSGLCCSIRWFVPLLAPAYYVLAVFIRDHPRYWPDFLILTGWGAVLGAIMWWKGPWVDKFPLYWPLQAAALLSWGGYRLREYRRVIASSSASVAA